MGKRYFTAAFRSLWSNKSYSFLNIGGLALGIACAGLIFLWVEDELSFNDYFANRDHLYKVKDRQTYDGTTFTFDATPGPLSAGIKAEIPGIKKTARTTWGNSLLFSLGEKSTYEQGLYVDPDFLTMFSLDFIRGNAATAFAQRHSVVLSETMAKKYFGTTDVLGRTLKVDNKDNYAVSGVIGDLPANVSFRLDWVSPFKIIEDQNKWMQSWGNNGLVTYVETQPNADIDAINKKLFNYIQTKQQDASAKMSIYPMSRWRMYDSFTNGKEVEGRIKYVHLFSGIAWIILLIACINFMNLSTARSERRAREVGVKKALGASKSKLIRQFMGESVLTASIAAIFAVLIMYVTLPAFNRLVEKQLSVGLGSPVHLLALVAITLICGIIAGSYPAFYLSSFRPVQVLKGIQIKNMGSAGWIRKGLVVTQFAISVILIIATIIIYQQINHIKDRDLGYNRKDLIYIFLQGKMKEKFGVIKNELLSTGYVGNATLSNDQVLQLGSNTGDFNWEGKDPSKQVLITVEGVSPEYTSTMGMRVKQGRDFYTEPTTDSSNVLINESLARIINKKSVIGTVLHQDKAKYTVVGVISDFVYNDMYGVAAPLILFSDTSNCIVLSVRLKHDAPLQAALASIATTVKKNAPGYPFDYSFVDEEFGKLFKTETLIGKLAGIFSLLAIVISCLGLFGLAAYTAERRTKEIGVRKVLGASVSGLAGLLSKAFLQLVVVACLIAFPIAWWVMKDWLKTYSYRIQIGWLVFVSAGLLALVIALLTVIFHALRAAMSNPVKSLRSE